MYVRAPDCRLTRSRGSCGERSSREPSAASTASGAASTTARTIFISVPHHALGQRLDLVAYRVPGHEEEEQEVDDRAQARPPRGAFLGVEEESVEAELPPDGRRLGAEVAEDQEDND